MHRKTTGILRVRRGAARIHWIGADRSGYVLRVHEVHVVRRFRAPIAVVFDALSDHERFLRDRVTRTRLVRKGEGARNGLGALREVRAPLIRFVEEVTTWEPPHRLGYHIRSSTLPIRHHGGMLTLREVDGGTEVTWETRFDVGGPFGGAVLGRAVKLGLARAFTGLLASAARRVEAC